mmetsp:Transcript_16347/g.19610  ORF Transcript_16347/g.19610 Transcript_16347/m.19610 type:complete len:226 (-) Transcript_16347:474-1151(-)
MHLELATVLDDHVLRCGSVPATHLLYLLDNFIVTFDDFPEHNVLAVQMWGSDGAEEELAAICPGACVGHGQYSRPGMLELEVLVLKLLSVDGLPTRAVAGCEVPSLAHEVGDNAMEFAALVVQWLATLTLTLLTSTEAAEVLCGFGHRMSKQLHDNSSCSLSPDAHVKVHLRILSPQRLLSRTPLLLLLCGLCSLLGKSGLNGIPHVLLFLCLQHIGLLFCLLIQ